MFAAAYRYEQGMMADWLAFVFGKLYYGVEDKTILKRGFARVVDSLSFSLLAYLLTCLLPCCIFAYCANITPAKQKFRFYVCGVLVSVAPSWTAGSPMPSFRQFHGMGDAST